MNRLFALVLPLLLALVASPAASAHGGAYRGPGGGYPGTGPGTGGGGPGGPTTGGNPGGPTTGGGGGAATLLAKKTVTPSHTDWNTWWEFNKHRFLNLRARLRSRTSVTGNHGHSKDLSGRPSFDELKGATLPLILELAGDKDPDIADSAVLALARFTPGDQGKSVSDAIKKALSRPEASVRQSAVLSLGVLGDSGSVDLLLDILGDRPSGRVALDEKKEIPEHLRGLAAVSLGLIGDVKAIAPLIAAYKADQGGDEDLRSSIVLSLGLFRDPPHEVIQFLLSVLDDPKAPDRLIAQVPIALMRGRETARPALPRLHALLKGKKTANIVRESCAIAAGELADAGDAEIIQELLDTAETATDDGASNFAFIALGSIGARAAADVEKNDAVLKQLERALVKDLKRPREKSQLPWIATAIALLGKELKRDSRDRIELELSLGEALDAAHSNEARAAIAIGLGLLESTRNGKSLLKMFNDTRDNELASALAESLGLMKFDDCATSLKARLDDERDARLRSRLAIGLGLLGDLDVADKLTKQLADVETLYGTAAVARSIGIVGDRASLEPLMKLASKKGKPSLVRAFSIVAIGLLGEKTPLPWNARIAENANYLANFPVMQEVLDIL